MQFVEVGKQVRQDTVCPERADVVRVVGSYAFPFGGVGPAWGRVESAVEVPAKRLQAVRERCRGGADEPGQDRTTLHRVPFLVAIGQGAHWLRCPARLSQGQRYVVRR